VEGWRAAKQGRRRATQGSGEVDNRRWSKNIVVERQKNEKTMKKNYSRRRRKGRGKEGRYPSPKNHMDGGGKPHKEVACLLYLERRRSFSH
jgi:hypothetical protein